MAATFDDLKQGIYIICYILCTSSQTLNPSAKKQPWPKTWNLAESWEQSKRNSEPRYSRVFTMMYDIVLEWRIDDKRYDTILFATKVEMPAHAFETNVLNELVLEYLEFHGFKV
ncbi:UNVERIFIED_CONTAM: hypothetical protein HDU68_006744 [Siphonaria sp. JEL0065]|nr:hypothetical protein HDU68_006744 [Siphonaria sp. JEL0065]